MSVFKLLMSKKKVVKMEIWKSTSFAQIFIVVSSLSQEANKSYLILIEQELNKNVNFENPISFFQHSPNRPLIPIKNKEFIPSFKAMLTNNSNCGYLIYRQTMTIIY